MKNLRSVMIILAVALFSINGMAQDKNNKDMANMKDMKDTKVVHPAVCVLYPTQGNKVTGTVRFTQVSRRG